VIVFGVGVMAQPRVGDHEDRQGSAEGAGAVGGHGMYIA
jgi:hypothetical protein